MALTLHACALDESRMSWTSQRDSRYPALNDIVGMAVCMRESERFPMPVVMEIPYGNPLYKHYDQSSY